MNIEAKVITSVCQNKDISTLLTSNVDELFTAYRDVWESLKNYYYKFKSVPEVGILMERGTKILSPSQILKARLVIILTN